MMRHREKMKSGDEFDAFSSWKKLLCVFQPPGVSAKTKKRFNRRIRKEARLAVRQAVGE